MVMIPVLKKGPFGLELDKAVQHIILLYKGITIGVIFSTLIAVIIAEVNLSSYDITDQEASALKKQILLALCVCAFALAYFHLCSYLRKGVEERNRTWIFPWFLTTGGVGIALIIIFFYSMSFGFGIVQLFLPIVFIFIFYCVMVVYSLYVDLGVNFVPDPPPQVVPS